MPASTSPSSSARCARSTAWTRACTASGPSAPRRAPPGTPTRRSSPTPTRPCARSGVDLEMVGGCAGADVVHSHTWYANMAGHLAKLLHGVPHVVTAHSLEPMRPVEGRAARRRLRRVELGRADGVRGGRRGHRRQRRHARRRPAQLPRRRPGAGARRAQRHRHRRLEAGRRTRNACRELGVDPDRPSVIFVGRITRQKGLPLFLRAAAQLPPEVQLVLCAGAPDTQEIAAEVRGLVDGLAAERDGVVWIAEMLPRRDVVALLTAATVFACPSIYEPLGIVNLEAMACETAVVATATGGIPEVVVDGETGWLVPIEQATDGTGTPLDPERYVADLAAALVDAVSDPDRARERGARRSTPGPGVVQLAGDRGPDDEDLPLTAGGLGPRGPCGRCGSDVPRRDRPSPARSAARAWSPRRWCAPPSSYDAPGGRGGPTAPARP